MDYVEVSLVGDPDDIAAQLLAPQLPRQSLDAIDIKSDDGFASLFAHLIARMGRASIEWDELASFVERNRRELEGGRYDQLRSLQTVAESTDRDLGAYLEYFVGNVGLVLSGRVSELDMRSDKLFYLVFALGHQLAHATISLADVQASLRRPAVCRRISAHQLIYMVSDYVKSMETPQEPPQTLLLVTAECSLLAEKTAVVKAIASLLAKLSGQKYLSYRVDLLSRAAAHLESRGIDASEIRQTVDVLTARGDRIADDDF